MGIAAPSGPVLFPERLDRGVRALEARGFRVSVGPVAASRGGSRSAEERAAELNGLIRDPEVRAVVAAIGGYRSNGLLELVDWAALRADPKILVGYSDITALLLGAVRAAGVVAFHGPTVLPELAEYPDVLPPTAAGFLRALTDPRPLGRIEPVAEWTEEFLAWGSADHRPRLTEPAAEWTWLGDGTASGPLLGGNLETLCCLAGTRFLPDFDGAVVCLETTATTLDLIDRDLDHLAMLGVFDRMAGLVFGHSFRGGAGFQAELEQRLTERFAARSVPCLLGPHLGHTDPMPTLPLGARCALDTRRRVLEVIDAAVR
ncbi:LD-carboxypeptidase [Streptomyces sp. DSM 44915]|uniref:LD-carboxypeptidase n=1 Tax=Streptomyces chisholmiae TaxID=3075540 RepID=A0ABU2JPA8_9ACTN|nr:LD-carboxypeptidase [Streptomyces sp. DSM 44915]